MTRKKQPDFSASIEVLKKDKKLARVIKEKGPVELARFVAHSNDLFTSLLRSITAQQISSKAAASIFARLVALFPDGKPTALLVSKIKSEKLRSAGLSERKVLYMKDLAEKYLDGTIQEQKFSRMTSQEIIDHLVQVKGVGEWTAQMLLIFSLHRLDVLPVDDLAIKKGFQVVYGLQSLPTKKQMEEIATPWREHATAASWYLWRASE